MQIMSMLIPGFIAYISAIIGSALAVLIMTRDTETIAFGALVSLFVLPSIAVFMLLNRFVPNVFASHVGFWLVSIIISGYFYFLYNQSLVRAADDGSGLMALHIVYAVCGASLFAYVALFLKLKH